MGDGAPRGSDRADGSTRSAWAHRPGTVDFFAVLGKEATITGSYAWGDVDFARAVELVRQGAIDVVRLDHDDAARRRSARVPGAGRRRRPLQGRAGSVGRLPRPRSSRTRGTRRTSDVRVPPELVERGGQLLRRVEPLDDRVLAAVCQPSAVRERRSVLHDVAGDGRPGAAASSMRKSGPPGSSHVASCSQNLAHRSGGMCEMKNPVNAASNRSSGSQSKRSACTYVTFAASKRPRLSSIMPVTSQPPPVGEPVGEPSGPEARTARELEHATGRVERVDRGFDDRRLPEPPSSKSDRDSFAHDGTTGPRIRSPVRRSSGSARRPVGRLRRSLDRTSSSTS